jgi:hypothetical protein
MPLAVFHIINNYPPLYNNSSQDAYRASRHYKAGYLLRTATVFLLEVARILNCIIAP